MTEAAAALFAFASDHSRDPLRWSPVVVEIALTQALPFDDGLSEAALDAVSQVLPGLVRFAHDHLPVSPTATRETLEAIPRWFPSSTRFALARRGILAHLCVST